MEVALELRSFAVFRGSTPVVQEIFLRLLPGEVIAIVGRNGAGKSSLLEGIAGLLPSRGELRCGDRVLTFAAPQNRLRAGIALVPEGRSLFPEMTVRENVALGGYLFSARERRRREQQILGRFPLLVERWDQRAGTLSGGEQQILAIGRALMSEPRVLLLDEPTAGLAPRWRISLAEIIRAQAEQTTAAVILVEDNLEFSLELADRVLGLSGGRLAFQALSGERPTPSSILRQLLEAETHFATNREKPIHA